MSEEAVGRLAELRAKNGRSIGELLPFAGEEKLARGESITELLPFLDDSILREYVKKALGR